VIQDQEDLSARGTPVTLPDFKTDYVFTLLRLREEAHQLGIVTVCTDLDYLIRRADVSFRLHDQLSMREQTP
jgi:hypothetical protein